MIRAIRHTGAVLSSLVLMLSSCSDQYNILGNSSIDTYEGSTLYLKVATSTNDINCCDSTEVLHGKFSFEGIVNTECMAQLFMGDQSLLPLVLENGKITISFTDAERTVSGGPLNTRLYKFLNQHSQLQMEISDNTSNMARLIIMGSAPSEYASLEKKSMSLQNELDDLWTSFIIDNSDNILGPTYFLEYTSQYFYPVITPQIEEILKHAPEQFLTHPDVQRYFRDALFFM